MAFGRITASGGQPEYYEYINEDSHPIFCLSPLEDEDTIKQRMRMLIEDKDEMQKMAHEGRSLAEKHNDVRNIAPLFVAHWEKHLNG